jgi:transcriptional regulator with XRE-family HTH domain
MKKRDHDKSKGARALSLLLDLRGISQVVLARELGLSKASVCRWVSGDRAIAAWQLPRIAEALSLSPDEKSILYQAATPKAFEFQVGNIDDLEIAYTTSAFL